MTQNLPGVTYFNAELKWQHKWGKFFKHIMGEQILEE
jgi:hypothetical protein